MSALPSVLPREHRPCETYETDAGLHLKSQKYRRQRSGSVQMEEIPDRQ